MERDAGSLEDPTADLRSYLDASPTPWHAVRSAAAMLDAAGFTFVDERTSWTDAPAAAYTTRGGALVAWRRPEHGGVGPLRIVGAHTDSPGLRVKPRAGHRACRVAPARRRDLRRGAAEQLARPRPRRRRSARHGRRLRSHQVDVGEPVARVPQLAIHLDRDVNERGLVLDRQAHLTPVWGTGRRRGLRQVDRRAGRDCAEPAWWELCLYDAQPAAVLGADRTLLASGRHRQPGVVLGGDRPRSPRLTRSRTARSSLCSTTRRSARRVRAGRPGRSSPPSSSGCTRRPAAPATICTGRSPSRRVSRRTAPTPSTPTTSSDTIPTTRRSSTTGRRSRSTSTSATPRRRRPRRCSARHVNGPGFRTRRSCRATTCRAARRSDRSPRPGSASRPSTSASRSCRCTRPASCAVSKTHRASPAALTAYFSPTRF